MDVRSAHPELRLGRSGASDSEVPAATREGTGYQTCSTATLTPEAAAKRTQHLTSPLGSVR